MFCSFHSVLPPIDILSESLLFFIYLDYCWGTVSLIMHWTRRCSNGDTSDRSHYCRLLHRSYKIPLSPHYSINCNSLGEKRPNSPGFHSITLYLSDSPLLVSAETDCHFWFEFMYCNVFPVHSITNVGKLV